MSPQATEPTTFEHQNERPRLDTVVDGLLKDQEIAKLPIEEQGRVITDRFIGALVRQGDIEGTGTTYNAADVLFLMDEEVDKKGVDGLKAITSKDGLRGAVKSLAMDERVGKLFGEMGKLLETVDTPDGRETFTLTSAAQIEGYLLAGGTANHVKNPGIGIHMSGDTWIPVILEQVQRMSQNPNLNWQTTSNARDMTTSSSPLIRNSGLDWGMAVRSAESTGVDMKIVERSAEKLQDRMKAKHDLGARAIFVATSGRIGSYSTSLKSRSGY